MLRFQILANRTPTYKIYIRINFIRHKFLGGSTHMGTLFWTLIVQWESKIACPCLYFHQKIGPIIICPPLKSSPPHVNLCSHLICRIVDIDNDVQWSPISQNDNFGDWNSSYIQIIINRISQLWRRRWRFINIQWRLVSDELSYKVAK